MNTELVNHWEGIYKKSDIENVGWYEEVPTPALKMIDSIDGLDLNDKIFIAGAGATTLVDHLLEMGYSSLIANDLSKTALEHIENRVDNKYINYIDFIVDDLTQPDNLLELDKVQLWYDRAVFHFLVDDEDRQRYRELMNNTVGEDGYVIMATFSPDSPDKCSGLPVRRHSIEDLNEFLGEDFKMIDSMEYIYTQPSGGKRPYVYVLAKRV